MTSGPPVCPGCRGEIAPAERRCASCGPFCLWCAEESPPGARFCRLCGTPFDTTLTLEVGPDTDISAIRADDVRTRADAEALQAEVDRRQRGRLA